MAAHDEPIASFSTETAQTHAPRQGASNRATHARKPSGFRPQITVHDASRTAAAHRHGDAPPTPETLLEDLALQFTTLVLKFVTDVRRTLCDKQGKPPTVARLVNTHAFQAALPLFAASAELAFTFDAINAAKAKTSPRQRTTPTAAAPPAQQAPARPATTAAPAPASNLQAAKKRPTTINRLPPPRPDVSHPPIPEDTRLSRAMTSRIARTTERMVGFQTMKLLEVETSAPIVSTLHLRPAINEGRYPAPSVIIRGKDARHHYVLGQPKHLIDVQPAYARFHECAKRGNRSPPELTANKLVDLNTHFVGDETTTQFLRNAASELQRLENPLIR